MGKLFVVRICHALSMTQNIYDNSDFFQAYSRMDRSLHGLTGAPEWRALQSMLPDLRGARVLDLGCGFGWFSRWAREQGAQSVLGFDVSENMLKRAIEMTSDEAVVYRRLDLEQIELPEAAFDLVFSSLVLHYVENLTRVVRSIHRALVPGGLFVFSTEHPIYTAPRRPEWLIQKGGCRTWPVDQYLAEGPRMTDWLTKEVIKQHRTIGTTVNLLCHSGFALTHLEEWGPTEDQIAAHPEWAEHRDRPMFLLISARKQVEEH
jgi:SAM-dependent methyltransferase